MSMDAFFGYDYRPQFSSLGGPNLNTAKQVPAVASNTLGVVASNSGTSFSNIADDGLFSGQTSLTMVALAIAGITLFYLWTRNIQGG